MVIRGKDAFWKHDELPGAFIQFGSNSEKLMGESYWEYVRLEVHKVTGKPAPPKLRITLSEPWDIPSLPPGNPHIRPYDMIHRNTRPYLYDVGQGILLMSVAQGPDAILEPYGVLKSTNAGQTWQPVNDLQYKSFAPLPMIRLPDNSILDVSRWAVKYEREEGVFIEMRYIFDPEANSFTMHESLIRGLPEGMGRLTFDRHIFHVGKGDLLVAVCNSAPRLTPGGMVRRALLLKSSDYGATWNYYSTKCPNPEPAVVRFSDTEMMAILRTGGWVPFEQVWSYDGVKTWSVPVTLEMGSVDADLVYMSNGVLACSYGRNGAIRGRHGNIPAL